MQNIKTVRPRPGIPDETAIFRPVIPQEDRSARVCDNQADRLFRVQDGKGNGSRIGIFPDIQNRGVRQSALPGTGCRPGTCGAYVAFPDDYIIKKDLMV